MEASNTTVPINRADIRSEFRRRMMSRVGKKETALNESKKKKSIVQEDSEGIEVGSTRTALVVKIKGAKRNLRNRLRETLMTRGYSREKANQYAEDYINSLERR